MPGDNCCIVGCHTMKKKCPAFTFHKLPQAGKFQRAREFSFSMVNI